MIKKLASSLILLTLVSMPIFGVEVHLPWDYAGDDLNITMKGQTSNTRVRWDEKTLFRSINVVNDYLWWSFAVVCTGLVIYGGYGLITANGDKKAMQKALWTLIGTAIGITIAMLSYLIVKLLVNLV